MTESIINIKGNKIKIAPIGVGMPIKKLSGSSFEALDVSNLTLYKASLKQEKIIKTKHAKAPMPLFRLKIDI